MTDLQRTRRAFDTAEHIAETYQNPTRGEKTAVELAALLKQFAETLVEDTDGDRMKLKLITAERDDLAVELRQLRQLRTSGTYALNAERERAEAAEAEAANWESMYTVLIGNVRRLLG